MKKTVIIGNLGQDAQVKTTQQGQAFSSFTVAVSEKRNGQETTTWFSCSGWGDRFTGNLVQYLKKGTKVYLEGNYSPAIYQRNDGTNDISHNFMVNHIELLGGQQGQGAPAQPAAAAPQSFPPSQPAAPAMQAPAHDTPFPNQQQRTEAPAMMNTSEKLAGQPAYPSTPGSGHSDDDLPF
jgi:single-strand DNA-binding protein